MKTVKYYNYNKGILDYISQSKYFSSFDPEKPDSFNDLLKEVFSENNADDVMDSLADIGISVGVATIKNNKMIYETTFEKMEFDLEDFLFFNFDDLKRFSEDAYNGEDPDIIISFE